MILNQASRDKKINAWVTTSNQFVERVIAEDKYPLQAVKKTSTVVYDFQTYSVINKLNYIKWVDEEGEIAPSEKTKLLARTFITDFYRVLKVISLYCKEPQVTVSPEGEIVFEWWNEKKKLIIYCINDSTEYIKVWGADIETEMNDGEIDAGNIANIAKWLWS